MSLALIAWVAAGSGNARGQDAPAVQGQVQTEIPYRDGTLTLLADFQERVTKSLYRARGNVRITFQDIVITSDEVEYDEASRQGSAQGGLRFRQDKQWFDCARAEFNLQNQTATFHEAVGFTDQEFLIRGKTVWKTGRDTYRVESGFVTACQEKNPKWGFTISSASVHVDKTSRLRHTLFKIKGIPVLYFPYLVMPMEAKERSSGLLPPHYGNSDSKGTVFSLGYYQTLGRSADVTAYGDYFSLRGLALGGIFRVRPSNSTRLFLQVYGIDDREDQGGANLIIDGESALAPGVRAVASANITTNFSFRQAFMDSFRLATVPEERSLFFVTQNVGGFSTNIAFQRDEVRLSGRSVVVRKSPSIEFLSLGSPLGRTPFIFEMRAAAEGLSRVDSVAETPKLVQRLDLYPRLSLRLPAFAGFSLVPSAGVRETYYGARISETEPSVVESRDISRHYLDFQLDLRMPTIERSFQTPSLGSFKHVIEPFAVYRRIWGNDNLRQIVRFDEQDAIADTNELEFGVINRILVKRGRFGSAGSQEFLSLGIIQKYYFDPTFGGALLPGQTNLFYPLNTVTGFASTGEVRRFPPTNFVLRVTPQPAISFDVRADYDNRYHRLRDASLSMNWQQEQWLASGTYIKTSVFETGTFASDHVQGLLGYGSPLRGFSTSVSLSYDLENANLLNSNMRVNYGWDCCGIALQYQRFDLGLRTERRLTFSFSLKGIGSFGNMRRPESLY